MRQEKSLPPFCLKKAPYKGGTHAQKTSETLEPQCFQKPVWNLSFALCLSSETHTEQSHFSTSTEKADSHRDPFLSVMNSCRSTDVGLHLVELTIVFSVLKGAEMGFDVLLLSGIAPFALLGGLDRFLCLSLSFC